MSKQKMVVLVMISLPKHALPCEVVKFMQRHNLQLPSARNAAIFLRMTGVKG